MSLFFGICFILYFLKLSSGRGFWSFDVFAHIVIEKVSHKPLV